MRSATTRNRSRLVVKAMGRLPRSFGVVTVLLATLLMFAVATSDAQTETSQQVKATCVKAGLMRPRGLAVHFWLQIYEYSTGPHPGIEYNLKAMPETCSGGYERILFANVRFRTTLRGWRTFHGFGLTRAPGQVEKPVAWIPTYNQSEATGGTLYSEWANPESSKSRWGKVQRVETHARLWVKDVKTDQIVGRRTFRVPTRFCRNPVRSRACAF